MQPAAELRRLASELSDEPLVRALVDGALGYALLLTADRQVVSANEALLSELGILAENSVVGLRPGEVLGCPNQFETSAGCGGSERCSGCGSLRALSASIDDGRVVEDDYVLTRADCDIPRRAFRIRSSPVRVQGHTLFLMLLQDVTPTRRQAPGAESEVDRAALRGAIARLPEALRDQLEFDTRRVRLHHLCDLLDDVAEYEPALAAFFRDRARTLDFETLLEVL